MLFKENLKIFIQTLTVSIYPKIAQNELNEQLIIKHQKPRPKLQIRSELKPLKAFRTGSTYSTNIYLYWKSALSITTLSSVSGHFKRFQLHNLLSQLTNLANIF